MKADCARTPAPVPFWGRISRAWMAVLFILLTGAVSARADQYDDLRESWKSYLITNGTFGTGDSGLVIAQSGHFYTNGTPASIASAANSFWSTMNTSASRTNLWSDLPLGSASRNIVYTYDRLQLMALAAATPGSSLKDNASLVSTLVNALDWMNANIYSSAKNRYDNWYHWEIGSPASLNNTAVLIYPALNSTQINNYCLAIDRFSPGGAQAISGGWLTAANRSDVVLNVTIRGILGKSSTKIDTARTNLSPAFDFVGSGDGFNADGSFIFHNYHPYNGHYGLVLLGDVAALVNLLKGSTWEITDPDLANVYSWVLNAYMPFVYNGNMLDMVRGRAVSWSYETAPIDGASVLYTMRQIAQFAPADTAAAITGFVNAPRLASGQFHFPGMDRVLALRRGFGFGISMSSSRIANYESINGGNLHGWFTGDGMTYLYVGDDEQQFHGDFWPTVDPYHLPGTTVVTTARANSANESTRTDQNWVGGAQEGQRYGVAGMAIHPAGTTLTGKKSWFMFDDEIVCLGAGISGTGATAAVHTTAENRRLGAPIDRTITLNGAAVTPTAGWSANLPSGSSSWCALSGTGGYYFPAGNANLQATITANSGSWLQINSIDTNTVYSDNYLKLWFDHGVNPTNATYSYVVLPGLDAAGVSKYALNPALAILANTANVQAVKKPALGVVAANFWTTGSSTADLITVNNRASVITSENFNSFSVGISDPTQATTGPITVTLNRAASALLFKDAAVTVTQLSPQIILSVNVNGSRGKAFQASFQLPAFALNATKTGSNVALSFPSRFGYNYQVQYKNSLTDAVWNPLGGVIAGDNAVKSVTDTATTSSRFYQLQAQ